MSQFETLWFVLTGDRPLVIISYLDANQFILPASGAAIGVEWHQGKRVEPGKRNNPTAVFLK